MWWRPACRVSDRLASWEFFHLGTLSRNPTPAPLSAGASALSVGGGLREGSDLLLVASFREEYGPGSLDKNLSSGPGLTHYKALLTHFSSLASVISLQMSSWTGFPPALMLDFYDSNSQRHRRTLSLLRGFLAVL